MANSSLNRAKDAKKDEFYTTLSAIEDELMHYTAVFKDKTVFCNCDDPYESNFFKYFALNFNRLGLRKVIAMGYVPSPVAGRQLTLDSEFPKKTEVPKQPAKKAYKIEITEVRDYNVDGAIDLADVDYLILNDRNVLTVLKGDGDFESDESVECLKEADIVVTNPPFSLFRKYVAQLVKYGKKYLIIGGMNAITYRDIFPLIQDNKMWIGYHTGDMQFTVPDYYEPRDTRFWIDEKGTKWRSLGNVYWFTNIDIEKRHEKLILYKTYSPEEYPRYDEFDAINVDRVDMIPVDYDGIMGVPVTFIEKYNPEQFEIVGNLGSYAPDGYSLVGSIHINGQKIYKRIAIRWRH